MNPYRDSHEGEPPGRGKFDEWLTDTRANRPDELVRNSSSPNWPARLIMLLVTCAVVLLALAVLDLAKGWLPF